MSRRREVRLRWGCLIRCTDVGKDPATGEVVALRCTYGPATRGGDAPDGRRVQGTIHWVSAPHALDVTLRLYDKLFTVPDPGGGGDDILKLVNPESLTVGTGAEIEPRAAHDPIRTRYPFSRT